MEFVRFFELIEAFQSRVLRAVSLFELHRGVNDLMNWRSAGLPREGFIDSAETMEYSFHGIGCRAETPEGPIDWDFGNGGRVDGFDLWRLTRFARDNASLFPEFANEAELKRVFDQAVHAGVIEQDATGQDDRLFYRNAV
jgi:hypothetical protein